MPTLDELARRAQEWIDQDVDAGDQRALRELVTAALSAGEHSEAAMDLASSLAGPLVFGTAGLRAKMGPGPHRMNRAVVIQAAAALAALVRAAWDGHGDSPLAVIGYDGRHRSRQFALDSAAVLVAAGLRVTLLDEARPTPILAFAVRQLSAEAGIMVTASHNPAADNGYKVYLGGRLATGAGQGVQIISPIDVAIADHLATVGPANMIARAAEGWALAGPDLSAKYLAMLPPETISQTDRPLRIVTTALHGVGGALLQAALHLQGFTEVFAVSEQAEPDADFPTVVFPNPEEPGALDLALTLAEQVNADLVIAVDPDADRCAVAVRDLHSAHASTAMSRTADATPPMAAPWRRLQGDEVGALLGQEFASHHPLNSTQVFANSIVSSRLLAQIAAAYGIAHQETLTGFKWIARVPSLTYGYEEAIGYCVAPNTVRDKDGISAAIAIARLAHRLQDNNLSLVDALDDLARRHGLYATAQVSERFSDPTVMAARLHDLLHHAPALLDGSAVVAVTDLGEPQDSPTGKLPPTPGIRMLTESGSRVIIRPSGTEPKLKTYLEVIEEVSPTASVADLTAARRRAADRLARIACSIAPAG